VICLGYLKGCPNLTAHGLSKYLNPSPATAKGYMKRPHQGIWSTRRILTPTTTHKLLQVPLIEPTGHKVVKLIPLDDVNSNYNFGSDLLTTHAAVIKSDKDSEPNIFCFSAFADKHTGILYTDMTGTFPFMSLKGNVCILIVYHYKSNAISALLITNFSNDCILAAHTQQCELLKLNGFTMKWNVMDNQASQVITKFLTTKSATTFWSNPTITESTYRPLRLSSLVPSQQPATSSPFSCGTD
jgi:hypothetical protein